MQCPPRAPWDADYTYLHPAMLWDRNGILVASRGRHIVGLSRYVRKLPTAVGETEALWRALINLVPEPADAPERQSFELLLNDYPCEQRD